MINKNIAGAAVIVGSLAGAVAESQAASSDVSQFTSGFGRVGMVTDGSNNYPTSNGKVYAIDTDLCDSDRTPDQVVVVTNKQVRGGDVNTKFSTVRATSANLAMGYNLYSPNQDGQKEVNPATTDYADGTDIKQGFYSAGVLLNQAFGQSHNTVMASVDWPNIKDDCGNDRTVNTPSETPERPNACNGGTCGVGGGTGNPTVDPAPTNPTPSPTEPNPPGPNPDAGAGVEPGASGITNPDTGAGGPPGPNASISGETLGILGQQFNVALSLDIVEMVTPEFGRQTVIATPALRVVQLG